MEKKLGIDKPFLYLLVDDVVKAMRNKKYIQSFDNIRAVAQSLHRLR